MTGTQRAGNSNHPQQATAPDAQTQAAGNNFLTAALQVAQAAAPLLGQNGQQIAGLASTVNAVVNALGNALHGANGAPASTTGARTNGRTAGAPTDSFKISDLDPRLRAAATAADKNHDGVVTRQELNSVGNSARNIALNREGAKRHHDRHTSNGTHPGSSTTSSSLPTAPNPSDPNLRFAQSARFPRQHP